MLVEKRVVAKIDLKMSDNTVILISDDEGLSGGTPFMEEDEEDEEDEEEDMDAEEDLPDWLPDGWIMEIFHAADGSENRV